MWQGGSHQTRRRSGLIRFGENEKPGVPQSAHTEPTQHKMPLLQPQVLMAVENLLHRTR